jgi:hypothetical protein
MVPIPAVGAILGRRAGTRKPPCGGFGMRSVVMRQMVSEIGGARRDRTADLLHAMQALSQLSYGPETVLFRETFRRVNNLGAITS